MVTVITVRIISEFSYNKINGTNLTDNGNDHTKVTIITTLNIGDLRNKCHNRNGNSKTATYLIMSSHNVPVFLSDF